MAMDIGADFIAGLEARESQKDICATCLNHHIAELVMSAQTLHQR